MWAELAWAELVLGRVVLHPSLTGSLLFSDKVRFWPFRLQKLDLFSWLKLR